MFAVRRFLLLVLLQTSLTASHAQPNNSSNDISSPVKKLVAQIRSSQDKQALKQMDLPSISVFLLGDYFSQATEQQLSEFTSLFGTVFSKIAFPKIRENMKELSSIIYENPDVKGNEAVLASTIFIKHPLKMQEMKLRYVLLKTRQGWKIKDVAVLGDSMLTGIRDDQVQPLLKEGGIEGLLKAIREKAEELQRVVVR